MHRLELFQIFELDLHNPTWYSFHTKLLKITIMFVLQFSCHKITIVEHSTASRAPRLKRRPEAIHPLFVLD